MTKGPKSIAAVKERYAIRHKAIKDYIPAIFSGDEVSRRQVEKAFIDSNIDGLNSVDDLTSISSSNTFGARVFAAIYSVFVRRESLVLLGARSNEILHVFSPDTFVSDTARYLRRDMDMSFLTAFERFKSSMGLASCDFDSFGIPFPTEDNIFDNRYVFSTLALSLMSCDTAAPTDMQVWRSLTALEELVRQVYGYKVYSVDAQIALNRIIEVAAQTVSRLADLSRTRSDVRSCLSAIVYKIRTDRNVNDYNIQRSTLRARLLSLVNIALLKSLVGSVDSYTMLMEEGLLDLTGNEDVVETPSDYDRLMRCVRYVISVFDAKALESNTHFFDASVIEDDNKS